MDVITERFYLKGQSTPVHVKDHVESVGNPQLLVYIPGVGHTVSELPTVVVHLHSLETPAPACPGAAYQSLVPWLGQVTVPVKQV